MKKTLQQFRTWRHNPLTLLRTKCTIHLAGVLNLCIAPSFPVMTFQTFSKRVSHVVLPALHLVSSEFFLSRVIIPVMYVSETQTWLGMLQFFLCYPSTVAIDR